MFKVKVEGEYVSSGKLKDIKFYEAEFEMEEGDVGKARAIIQNGLIRDYLRKNVDGYGRWRTCQVVGVEEVKGKEAEGDTELHALLLEATELECIPPSYNSYGDDKLRKKALTEAIKKKKVRVANYNKKTGKAAKAGDVVDQGYIS